MRRASCILGWLFITLSSLTADKAFEFDDLTPITPIQPKVKAQEPAQPKATEPEKKSDSAPIPEIKAPKEEASQKLDLGLESDFDLIPEKKTEKAIESIPSLPPLKKEEKKIEVPVKPIDLSPEMPSPIKAEPENKSLIKKPEIEVKTPVQKELPPPRALDIYSEDKEESLMPSGNQNWITLMLLLFATGLIFLYFWYQKFLRGKMQAHGVDIQVLGQTFLDGQTKIVLLKVGQKVIVMAKSPNFCTTLDIITEPEEINLLTLGSSAAANGEDFSNVLNDMQKTSQKSSKAKSIPNEREMRSELDQLKKQLGQYQKDLS